MIGDREFIRSVSLALWRAEPTEPPPSPSALHNVHRRVMAEWSREQLVEAFLKNSRDIGAETRQTHKAELNDLLAELAASSGGTCLLADQPLFAELNTSAVLGTRVQVEVWDVAKPSRELLQTAAQASVGIAAAELALAESATVVLFSSGGLGRSVTLMPESTVFVIPQSVVRPRLTQAMELLQQKRHEGLPASVNLVSGPSATSDIELVRVVGVHGPMRVVHVLVEDL